MKHATPRRNDVNDGALNGDVGVTLLLALEARSVLAPAAHLRPSSIPESQLSDRRVRHPIDRRQRS